MSARGKKLLLKHKDKKKVEEVEVKPTIFDDIYIFPNGDRYEGQLLHTIDGGLERSGFGKHITADGTVYEGIWKQDAMNGHGKLSHCSGDHYEGQFVNNQFHGKGTYTWANGSLLKGIFVENRVDGRGLFTDTMKQIWEGDFHNKTAPGLRFKLNMG